MHVTAKADYAVRAVVELAGSSQAAPRKVDDVAQAQGIPVSFLENILTQLRSSGVVRSQRGPEGGYWLAHPAEEVDLAHVIRAVEGPLVGVRGQRPEEIEYTGSAESLQQVWIALRANLRKVLEETTVANVAEGRLPKEVAALTQGRRRLGAPLAGAWAGARRRSAARGPATSGVLGRSCAVHTSLPAPRAAACPTRRSPRTRAARAGAASGSGPPAVPAAARSRA